VTTPSPFSRRQPAFPSLPKGDVLGSYETYPEAQAVVDRLAKAEFPVKEVSIVGSDLKTVERVTGKNSWAKAAGAGAASGAWLGLFFGLILFLFGSEVQIAYALAAILIGAGFGMALMMASYAINRRRHDFTSVNQVLASRYEVLVEASLLIRAQELLAKPVPTD
jgi:hypothetical protein